MNPYDFRLISKTHHMFVACVVAYCGCICTAFTLRLCAFVSLASTDKGLMSACQVAANGTWVERRDGLSSSLVALVVTLHMSKLLLPLTSSSGCWLKKIFGGWKHKRPTSQPQLSFCIGRFSLSSGESKASDTHTPTVKFHDHKISQRHITQGDAPLDRNTENV